MNATPLRALCLSPARSLGDHPSFSASLHFVDLFMLCHSQRMARVGRTHNPRTHFVWFYRCATPSVLRTLGVRIFSSSFHACLCWLTGASPVLSPQHLSLPHPSVCIRTRSTHLVRCQLEHPNFCETVIVNVICINIIRTYWVPGGILKLRVCRTK